MTMTKQLQAQSDGFRTAAPADVTSTIENGIALVDEGLSPLEVGAMASDFTLPSATGGTVQLSELLKSGPVVLNFYRGGWCPFCNLELRAFHAVLPEIEARGASLVAISPETPDNTMSTRETQELGFDVLSDVGSEVGRAFGLAFTLDDETKRVYEGFGLDLPTLNGQGSWELVVPGTYVIAADGTVAASFVDADYRRRTEPQLVLDALDSIEVSS